MVAGPEAAVLLPQPPLLAILLLSPRLMLPSLGILKDPKDSMQPLKTFPQRRAAQLCMAVQGAVQAPEWVTQEAEAGGAPGARGQPELHSENLSKARRKRKEVKGKGASPGLLTELLTLGAALVAVRLEGALGALQPRTLAQLGGCDECGTQNPEPSPAPRTCHGRREPMEVTLQSQSGSSRG